MTALLLFPNQLYFTFPEEATHQTRIFLVEESLFFKQYAFHKQKLIFHRSTLKQYASHLIKNGYKVEYIDSVNPLSDLRNLLPYLLSERNTQVGIFEPEDNWLKARLIRLSNSNGINLQFFENQLFLNSVSDLDAYRLQTKKLFQTDFYIYQRKLRNILIDEQGGPLGGKWSFDSENRKKYPTGKKPPGLPSVKSSSFDLEALEYVKINFSANPGSYEGSLTYPTCPESALRWLQNFFEQRFNEFGLYEDALVSDEPVLHHSVLTPMLNVGILKPKQVIDQAIQYAQYHSVELNNLEGFVRQILGWREFVRYVYHYHGVEQRTKNFWGFERKIPQSFYEGTTGIQPVDDAIRKVLNTSYNHHIERLMVISNFMLLCEFHPDEVYRWFMEMYIDAYDWVMVPNVYGMAQFADGGLMCTKPYISGSNYVFKMSNYKKGEEWAEIWDALFWRFLFVNRDFFKKNPRLSMLINTFEKWDSDKRNRYLLKADTFLHQLDSDFNPDRIL